jgi:hypothetical protein
MVNWIQTSSDLPITTRALADGQKLQADSDSLSERTFLMLFLLAHTIP